VAPIGRPVDGSTPSYSFPKLRHFLAVDISFRRNLHKPFLHRGDDQFFVLRLLARLDYHDNEEWTQGRDRSDDFFRRCDRSCRLISRNEFRRGAIVHRARLAIRTFILSELHLDKFFEKMYDLATSWGNPRDMAVHVSEKAGFRWLLVLSSPGFSP